jgi:DNA-binding GntR family transcriptional regulator
VVKLENGRLYSRNALEELSAVDGEVDDRRAAELWGVSRNTARLLIDRLVAEGLLARTSGRAAAPMGRGGGRR